MRHESRSKSPLACQSEKVDAPNYRLDITLIEPGQPSAPLRRDDNCFSQVDVVHIHATDAPVDFSNLNSVHARFLSQLLLTPSQQGSGIEQVAGNGVRTCTCTCTCTCSLLQEHASGEQLSFQNF